MIVGLLQLILYKIKASAARQAEPGPTFYQFVGKMDRQSVRSLGGVASLST